jgi:hypothetical protein
LLSFTIDEWDNIVVFDETGALIGRINNWSGDDEWTNWQDNKVTNTILTSISMTKIGIILLKLVAIHVL